MIRDRAIIWGNNRMRLGSTAFLSVSPLHEVRAQCGRHVCPSLSILCAHRITNIDKNVSCNGLKTWYFSATGLTAHHRAVSDETFVRTVHAWGLGCVAGLSPTPCQPGSQALLPAMEAMTSMPPGRPHASPNV
jgi:hypothetical protein